MLEQAAEALVADEVLQSQHGNFRRCAGAQRDIADSLMWVGGG